MNFKANYHRRVLIKKTLLFMKMTTFFLFSACLAASAGGFAQRVTLSANNVKIGKIFKEIKKQTGYVFFYEAHVLQETKRVSVHVKNETVGEVLKEILQGEPVDFSILRKTVTIVKKKNQYVTMSSVTPLSPPMEDIPPIPPAPVNIITGSVKDAQGNPLAGVSVIVKGTKKGTSTNTNGSFSIDANVGDVLEFTIVGYQKKSVVVGQSNNLSVVMEIEVSVANEVVVVGYGTEKEKNLTSSVTVIKAKSIGNQILTNSAQALQGARGVYVQQKSGAPGAEGVKLHIRGIGTLNTTAPLVLINGIEGNLSDLNPNDIESISILKDAASTAIFGSRASNGVILVTTKSGSKGKPQVEYHYDFGLQEATRLPDEVTNSVQYMEALNTAYTNEGIAKPYSDAQIDSFRLNPNPFKNPNTDWIDYVFKVSPIQKHNLSISGGSDKTDYRVSFGYLDQKGVMIGNTNKAKSYLGRGNFNFNISRKLKAGADFSFSYRNHKEPSNTTDGTINYAFKALPIQPVTLEDGRYAVSWVNTPHAVSPINVAAILTDDGFIKNEDYNTRINLHANYTLPADIELLAQFGIDKGHGLQDKFIPVTFVYNPIAPETPLTEKYTPSERSSIFNGSDNLYTTFISTLNWDKTYNGHNIKLLGGFSRLTYNDRVYNASSRDFLGNGLTLLSGGSTPLEAGEGINESRLLSFFSRVNYIFRQKYLFEYNMRYDGSSKFSKGHRWGFFPSFSVGWRISQEGFFKNIEAISDLKLRASWGEVGNNGIPNFAYLNTINTGGIYSFNNNIVPAASVSTFSDPNITWETTIKRNIGIDMGIASNRVMLHLDAFSDKTKDILTKIIIPEQVGGLSGPLSNFYSMRNKGIEMGIDFNSEIGKLKINLGGQFTHVKNEVTFLNGDDQIKTNEYGDLSIIKEGYPVNSFFLYKAIGIFQDKNEIANHATQGPTTAPGDIMYADINGDGVIDSKDRIITGQSALPKNTYGLNIGLSYAGVSLNAFFQGVQGINAYPVQNLALPLYNGAGITKSQLEQAWSEDNRNAKYPRLTNPKYGFTTNYLNNTLWLQDASYLRLKSLRVAYTLKNGFGKEAFKNLTIYLNGQNLFTITDFTKAGDPENVAGESDLYVYPILKIYNIGINVNF